MEYAYGRVSAKDQNLDRQIAEFIKFGVSERNIFAEKKSGKDFERAAYKRLISTLKSGDLLIIKSIDRLGRNYDEIIFEWDRIVNGIKADILVLDMPLLDTRVKKDRQIYIGHCFADTLFRCRKRAHEHKGAASGRNKNGAGERR